MLGLVLKKIVISHFHKSLYKNYFLLKLFLYKTSEILNIFCKTSNIFQQLTLDIQILEPKMAIRQNNFIFELLTFF